MIDVLINQECKKYCVMYVKWNNIIIQVLRKDKAV